MIIMASKDIWDALEVKFGLLDAGSELYVMGQYHDNKMSDDCFVVEHAHEISHSLRHSTIWVVCLPDKFIVERFSLSSFLVCGGILLLFWSTGDNKFLFSIFIGTLDVEENTKTKDTRACFYEGTSSANLVHKKYSQSHKIILYEESRKHIMNR